MKEYKPITPSLRQRVIVNRDSLHKGKPFKPLTRGLRKSGGRNSSGKITAYHIGGGAKRLYRKVDFKSQYDQAVVIRVEYDPNRSANIALIKTIKSEKDIKLHQHKEDLSSISSVENPHIPVDKQNSTKGYSYILAHAGINVGDIIKTIDNQASTASDSLTSSSVPHLSTEVSSDFNQQRISAYQDGNTLRLTDIPLGSLVHNIELTPGQGGKLVRAAGTSARVVSKGMKSNLETASASEQVWVASARSDKKLKQNKFASIQLPSGEIRLIHLNCKATIGRVGNQDHSHTVIGGAGYSRHLGRRPITRGVAMNPVDHPHGGGEGKTSGGRPSVSPWGKLTKGQKTVKKPNKLIISRRTRNR